VELEQKRFAIATRAAPGGCAGRPGGLGPVLGYRLEL
jgi:hypothetical protein